MPGVSIKFLPRSSSKLILAALSVGFAMKKLAIGIDEPAAAPSCQVVPDEFVCSAGTKTLKLPLASIYRNGFSRGYRTPRQSGVGIAVSAIRKKILCWSADNSGEYLIPNSIGPTIAEDTVSGEPLLLRAAQHFVFDSLNPR